MSGVAPNTPNKWFSEYVGERYDRTGENEVKANKRHMAAKLTHYDAEPDSTYACSYEVKKDTGQRDTGYGKGGRVILDTIAEAAATVPSVPRN